MEEHMKSISPPKKTDKVGSLCPPTFFLPSLLVPGPTCLRMLEFYHSLF